METERRLNVGVARSVGALLLTLLAMSCGDDALKRAPPGATPAPGGPLLTHVDRLCTFLLVGASDAAGYYASGLNEPGGHGYARLILTNDDVSYPELAGRDLASLHSGLTFVDQAESGFTSQEMRVKLAASIDTIDRGDDGCDTYLHVGDPGNDFNDDIAVLIDPVISRAAAAAARANLAEVIAMARARFADDGSGRTLIVTMSTIQDPTDGTGRVPPELTEGFCELIANPAIPDDVRQTALANLDHWNAEIAEEAEAQGAGLLDQHAVLLGRGMAAEPRWYHPDCSHPNDAGHDAIRRFAWWLLADEWFPRPDAAARAAWRLARVSSRRSRHARPGRCRR